MSVDGLVVAAFRRALRGSDTLLTFLLRCHRPAIYNISHAEQIGEPADDKKVSLQIYYNNEQPLSELLAFPIHKSMGQGHDSAKVARQKQRRLAGDFDATAEAPEEISDAPPESTISDAPPPQVVDKRLTGRIPDHWKGGNDT